MVIHAMVDRADLAADHQGVIFEQTGKELGIKN